MIQPLNYTLQYFRVTVTVYPHTNGFLCVCVRVQILASRFQVEFPFRHPVPYRKSNEREGVRFWYSTVQRISDIQSMATETHRIYIHKHTHTRGYTNGICTRCTLGSTEIIGRRIEKLMNFESATNTFAWKHVHKYLYTGRRKGLCKRKDNGSNRSEFDSEWKKTATKQMTSFLLRPYENGNKNGSVTVEMQQQQSIAFGERGATCEWNRFEGIHPKFMFMRNEHFVGFAFNKMPFAFIRLLSFDSMLCSDGDCRN